MSEAAFEQQVQRFMDPNTGERRLTCTSRQRIPENVGHSERADEWAGMSLTPYKWLTAAHECDEFL